MERFPIFAYGSLSEEEVAKRYRFIAYTQRYHGVGVWKDDGQEYSTATHADDLAKFITSLNVGFFISFRGASTVPVKKANVPREVG